MRRPLLLPLASVVLGLSAADLFGVIPPPWTLAVLLLVALCACCTKGGRGFNAAAALLFFVWGALSLAPFLAPAPGLSRQAGDAAVVIEGVVEGRPEAVASGGARLCLQVERLYRDKKPEPASGKLLVFIREGRVPFLSGDRLLFSSRIGVPRRYGLPGESDYPRQLAYQGIFATAFANRADDLVLLSSGSGWRRGVDRISQALGRFIDGHAPAPERAVLKALLIGDRGDVPPEVNDAYARSGVNHILSISGFHVGIIYVCLFQTFFWITRCSETLALTLNLRRTALLMALPVVLFYLFLSGAAPATQRSVLMIGACAAALFLNREIDPVNGIMLAALAIIAAAPEELLNLSLQLSFLAIWGLAVFTPLLEKELDLPKGARRWLLLLMIASVAAIAATTVPVAYYFHRVSWIGLLSNLIIVPLMGYGAVVLGFISLVLSFCSEFLATPVLCMAAWLVKLSDQVVLLLARVPSITSYRPGRIDLCLSYLLLSAVTFIDGRRLRLACIGALLGALFSLGFLESQRSSDGLLRVTFLSIGQGDSTLVRLPDGKAMLIDGGGSFHEGDHRVGERLLLPALWRLGVSRIDYLVLSHAHPDHLQGLLYIASNLEVTEFWESGVPSASYEYQKLKWILSARGIAVRTLRGGGPAVCAGGALVEPLWPRSAERPKSGDDNDISLVFRLRYGRSSVLFTGDLGSDAEEGLLEGMPRLSCSILKVGHHGSRYSSSEPFLAAVSPKAAVISAGYRNSFRLPAPATLSRLAGRGIPVYRTDLMGSVEAVCSRDGGCQLSTPWGHFD